MYHIKNNSCTLCVPMFFLKGTKKVKKEVTVYFTKTFDRRFAKFVVNFISSLQTWEFHYVTDDQIANVL